VGGRHEQRADTSTPCRARTSTSSMPSRHGCSRSSGRWKGSATWPTDQQNRGLQASLVIDRDTASRLGILPQLIDDTLYDAFGQRQVSNIYTPLNQYPRHPRGAPAYQQNPDALKVDLRQVQHGQPGAALRLHSLLRGDDPSRREPPELLPRRHLVFQPRPRRRSRRCRGEHPGGGAADEHARFDSRELPGDSAGLSGVTGSQPILIPRRPHHRVHRPRRPLRKLHSSHHILSTLPSAGVGAILALLLFGGISTSSR